PCIRIHRYSLSVDSNGRQRTAATTQSWPFKSDAPQYRLLEFFHCAPRKGAENQPYAYVERHLEYVEKVNGPGGTVAVECPIPTHHLQTFSEWAPPPVAAVVRRHHRLG